MATASTHQKNNHSAARNITILTIVFVASLWGFFTYWAVTTKQETLFSAENGLSQMAHAVEQYSTHLFKMAEIFQATTERWLSANSSKDPRTDSRFVDLIEDFRTRTDNLIDIRMASANGDLYYFPGDPDQPNDNVSDREYFKAVIYATPGLRHIGMPVVSRVSGQWRLPITARMPKAHHGLEIINTSVNLSSLVNAFESERARPNGTISLWNTDGTLLVRAPQVEELIGKQAAANWVEWGKISTQPNGRFLSETTPIDGAARLVAHAQLKDFPLVVVVTAALSDTLDSWYRQVFWGFIALALLTVGGAMFSARLIRALQVQEHHALELERLATTDSLTGVFNRRQFMEAGMQELARSRRYNNPMSLLMLDIDNFKTVNDTWGHPTGDRALQTLTEVIGLVVRDQDTVGRLGGEEFAVILPETALAGARIIAERMLAVVQQSTITSTEDGNAVGITVSIGIATSSLEDVSFDAILSRADKRLYEAKKRGRNCVVTC